MIEVPEHRKFVELVAQNVRDAGYQAKVENDEGLPFILSATLAFRFFITPYPDGSIQFRGFASFEPKITLEDCNSINSSYRFLKIYLDSDTVVVESDYLSQEPLNQLIERCFRDWEASIEVLREFNRNRATSTHDVAK